MACTDVVEMQHNLGSAGENMVFVRNMYMTISEQVVEGRQYFIVLSSSSS